MKKALVSILIFVVSSCATISDGTKLPSEKVDNTYKERKLRWTGTYEGLESKYYIKTFERDGMLAICALRIRDPGEAEILSEKWFYNAFVIVGSRKNKVARASFFAAADASTDRSAWSANCIKTNRPASDQLLNGPVGVTGSAVEEWY